MIEFINDRIHNDNAIDGEEVVGGGVRPHRLGKRGELGGGAQARRPVARGLSQASCVRYQCKLYILFSTSLGFIKGGAHPSPALSPLLQRIGHGATLHPPF